MTTPADYTGLNLWLPTAFTEEQWTGAIGSSNPNVDDLVKTVECQVGLTAESLSDTRRVNLRQNTRMSFDISGIQQLRIISSQATFNHFHVNGTGTIMCYVKFDNATSSGETIIDSTTSTTSNKGLNLSRVSGTNKIIFLLTKAIGGTPIINLTSTDSIADTNWHKITVKVATGTNNTSIQIDSGTPTTGTLGTLTTGNASDELYIGIRSSTLLFPLTGEISDLVILNQVVTSDDETHYAGWNPPLDGYPAGTFESQWFWHKRNWQDWYNNKYLFRSWFFPNIRR